jgi:hypothetical protein
MSAPPKIPAINVTLNGLNFMEELLNRLRD